MRRPNLLDRQIRPQSLVSHVGSRDCCFQRLCAGRDGRRVYGSWWVCFSFTGYGSHASDEGGSADESTLGDLGNIFLTVSSAVAAAGMPLIGNASLEDTTA